MYLEGKSCTSETVPFPLRNRVFTSRGGGVLFCLGAVWWFLFETASKLALLSASMALCLGISAVSRFDAVLRCTLSCEPQHNAAVLRFELSWWVG